MENTTVVALTPVHKGIFMVIWLLALALNFLSAIVMGRTIYKKKTWPNVFVFALNLNDLSCLVAGQFLALIAVFSNLLLRRLLKLCEFQAFILNVTHLSSVTIVTFILLDRYVAVCHPFYYNRKAKAGGSKVIFAVLFVVVLIVLATSAMPLALGVGYTIVEPGVYCYFDWNQRQPRGRAVILLNLLIGLVLTTTALYLTVAVCAHLYRMVKEKDVIETYNSGAQVESYFLKLSVVIGIAFATCSLPLLVTIALCQGTICDDADVSYIVLSVQFLSSAINPVLYAAARPATRRGYIEVFKWAFYFSTCCPRRVRPMKSFDEVIGLTKGSAVVASDTMHSSGRTANSLAQVSTGQQNEAMCLEKITV